MASGLPESCGKLQLRKTEYASRCFPTLACTGKSQNTPVFTMDGAGISTHVAAVTNLVLELVHKEVSEAVQELSGHEQGADDRTKDREHIIRKLQRITPGEVKGATLPASRMRMAT